MNTKLLMITSSLTLGILGIFLSFLPQEVAGFLGWPAQTTIALQLSGALYFGFAMVNWMAKENLIGGIYGRPVAIGNFSHFMIAAPALLKFYFKTPSTIFLIFGTIYFIYAILFGYISFKHPALKAKLTLSLYKDQV